MEVWFADKLIMERISLEKDSGTFYFCNVPNIFMPLTFVFCEWKGIITFRFMRVGAHDRSKKKKYNEINFHSTIQARVNLTKMNSLVEL